MLSSAIVRGDRVFVALRKAGALVRLGPPAYQPLKTVHP